MKHTISLYVCAALLAAAPMCQVASAQEQAQKAEHHPDRLG